MDPVHLCIALGPVAVYFMVLATINLARRPFLVTGVRDTLALGLAIGGLVVAGPLELFMPRQAAASFGFYVWVPLLALYLLGIVLVALLRRPRLIVFNMTLDQLRPLLAEIVSRLDPQARWAGECLMIPGLGVQLYIEDYPAMSNVELIAVGPKQELSGWKQLERELWLAMRELKVRPSAAGWGQVALAVLIVAMITYSLVNGREEVAQALRVMLRL